MTLAELEQILGRGQVASPAEMDRLYAGLRGGSRGKTWQQHGRIAQVKTWYGWVNGNDAIHVGFFESMKHGLIVSAKIAVLHQGGGTLWLELANPPGGLDPTRDDMNKVRDAKTDPKWVRGPEARKLLVGKWQQKGTKLVYQFLPNGKMKASGNWHQEVSATWRFLDDEHVEFALPYVYREDRGPPETYKFVVNATEMTMWWKFGELRPHGEWTRVKD